MLSLYFRCSVCQKIEVPSKRVHSTTSVRPPQGSEFIRPSEQSVQRYPYQSRQQLNNQRLPPRSQQTWPQNYGRAQQRDYRRRQKQY